MDLGLSERHQILKRTARELLEAECPAALVREIEDSERGYSPDLWKQMADLGWLGLALPPEYGGSGGDLVDQVVLFEELGRAIVPSPVLPSTVLCGQTLLNAGGGEQKERLLPGISRGDTIVVPAGAALPGGPLRSGLQIRPAGDGSDFVIEGSSLFVPYAHVADYLLCASMNDGGPEGTARPPRASGGPETAPSARGNEDPDLTLCLVETGDPGVSATLLPSVGGYKQHEVALQDAKVPNENMVGQVGRGWGPLTRAMEWTTVVQCAEMVGRAQKVLDMVVEYSKIRVQFGRPIGSFQAVQHRCADLKVAVDGARLVNYQAAWKMVEGLPCSEDVAIAKAFAGSLSRQATVAGHAIFAGIAFTADHDMQLYSMRSKIAEANLGDTEFHLDRLGKQMGFT
jgi:alkylation response protein AidB-like acyl-CoA dehydrogenase